MTPEMIANAPTGVEWSVIPFPDASNAQQVAEQTNICWRATNMVDAICNQPLRATLDIEEIQGPDWRMTVDASGVARAMTSRWPVLSVQGAQVSPRAAIPRSWNAVPTNAIALEDPPMNAGGVAVYGASGAGGSAVLVAPGYISWFAGRNGYTLQLAYLNGWPHTALTAAASAGDATISVDNVTGWVGVTGFVYDGSDTEVTTATAATANTPTTLPTGGVVQTGPGTLTLAEPLAFDHEVGVVVSALPQDIAWATILLAAAQVLESGVTSVTVQNLGGSQTTGGKGVDDLRTEARRVLAPYKRVI